MNALLDAHGWYQGARPYPSAHCDARPPGTQIDLLVIHNISLPGGQFGGPHIADLFTGRVDYNAHPSFAAHAGLRVSAHFLIRRDGRVLQFVGCDQRAWHAGLSVFAGRERCNDFSIGVELEGSDAVPFSNAQYAALVELTLALQTRYRLTDVQGHQHVAPGRKTDPGPCFDWHGYAKLLAEQRASVLARNPMLALTHSALRFPS